MLKKIGIVLIFAACVSFSSISHLSAEKYDVSVGMWGMFVTKSDNLWGNGKRTITSIYSKPDSSSFYLAFPYIDFKVIPENGAVGGKGATTFYINSALEPGSLSAGVRQRFEKSSIDIYGFYSLVAKDWQNPYVLYRTSTSTRVFGGKIIYGNAFDTNFSLSYRASVTDVSNDVIGSINSDLRQDGMTHTFSINYRQPLTEILSLIPALTYERGEYDGKSNSYNQYEGSLALNMHMSVAVITARIYGNTAQFDSTHPIYFKTRDGRTYGAGILATFPNPFGWKKYAISAGINSSKTDSNITFFESDTTMGFVSLGYQF
ncbi:MAG: DUF2860 family protein [Proteobacteria bacterium]|nr:DUF2860 family protein [Pseudomonadota bacterium]